MEREKILDDIIEKINVGDDDYDIKKFLERKEIHSEEFDALINKAKQIILDHKLKIYPKQNRIIFRTATIIFVSFFIFFFILLPLFEISNVIIPVSILGAFCISISGYYSLLYYKSWEKKNIEKIGKPKLDLQTFFLVSILPAILSFFIISWNFLEGPGHNLYKLGITAKALKSFFH